VISPWPQERAQVCEPQRRLLATTAAAAAGAFAGDLQAAVADGQATQQAGQDLFNHLRQVLGPPGQGTRQIQQRYLH
jgi:hypothetical protein